MIDQSAHGISIIPVQLEYFFDSQQDYIPPVYVGYPSRRVAKANIQNDVDIQFMAEAIDDSPIQIMGNMIERSVQSFQCRMAMDSVDDRQNIIFINMVSAIQIFL